MSIIHIKKREHPYVQIDKRCLSDERLSWRARGILAYLLSKPDNWTVQVKDIENHGLEGRDAVQNALKELQKLGYASLETMQDEHGRLLGKKWVVKEEPTNGFSGNWLNTDELKNRPTEKPFNGKSAPTNNELNTENEFQEEKKDASLFSSSPENENQTLEAEKKETPPPSCAASPPLLPPFTPTGETIEPQPAKVVRLYEPELPGVTVIDSVPATHKTTRGKPENRFEPHVHPENENIFSHFTEPERARAFWGEWLRYKHDEKKQRYKTPQTELAALRRLWDYSHGETAKAGEIIETAIANLWQGFFKPKEEIRFTNKAVENHATLANIVLESRRAAFGHGDG